jgi:hypothetical protein
MSGRDFGTRHILFYFIIKVLSATTDGFGRESADRIASRSDQHGLSCKSVFGKMAEYDLRHRVASCLPKLPDQICISNAQERLPVQFCPYVRDRTCQEGRSLNAWCVTGADMPRKCSRHLRAKG